MKVTRRDLLVWSAGAAAGLLVTPVPWKLLDDTSIWSQNWPWIPQPARGPVEVKQSLCTLVSQWMWHAGEDGRRMARGGCRGEQSSHQPRGIVPARFWSASAELASAAVADGASSRPVLPLGTKPRRHFAKSVQLKDQSSSSTVIRAAQLRRCSQSFAEKRNGSYRVVLGPETRALAPYETWSGVPGGRAGLRS